jgi:TonB family protein
MFLRTRMVLMQKSVSVFASTVLGASLLFGVGSVSSFAQTANPSGSSSLPASSASRSQAVDASPIENQEDWKRAVASILQRYGGRLVGDLRPLELDGVFTAKISFDLSPDGKVSDIKLVESSGNGQVDAATLKIPARDAAFPAFAPDMSQDGPKKIVAPFVVHLEKPTPPTTDPAAPAKAK